MSVCLIGYRGCGKTTIGKRLADQLWQPFADTDELIVARAGKSIKDIFEQDGEPAFRDLETTILRDALQLTDHVLSLGGGIVLREENRELLQNSGRRVIYLRCEPQVLLQRIQSDPNSAANRPNLTNLGGGIDEITSLLAQREPLYRQVMSAELDVTHLSPAEAVVYVVRLM